jgi:hypothetical protein
MFRFAQHDRGGNSGLEMPKQILVKQGAVRHFDQRRIKLRVSLSNKF